MQQPQHILLINDEPDASDPLFRALAVRGFSVSVARKCEASPAIGPALSPDAVLIDMKPIDPAGWEACQAIRATSTVPIVLLVGSAGIGSVIRGIDAGADDFIVKPFSADNLTMRIAVLLKQRETRPGHLLRAHDLTIDLRRRSASRGGRALQLSRREFEILAHLVRNQGVCISRSALAERAGLGDSVGSLKVNICNLRSKLNAKGEPDIIESRRGFGYVLRSS